MARPKKNLQTTPATVKVDAVDELTAKLSEIGVEFVRDAWVNKAPDNYGVTELQGEPRQLWADGHLIDSLWTVIVTMFVNDGDDSWAGLVNEKLAELEEAGKVDLTHTCTRAFDYEVGKVRWTWAVTICGDLVREEPAGDA
jgi:hypothetical protein